ncbi:MAG: UDP-N-acetylmuramoyl-L-alanyl-D-glutamate--2,6-diaminopimelate ligase [Clostridia bacterium]|nr:UDP-N-acetylmuramoyl-L-alanyl-D-glutamate--2,6-diaminopimelate ligase [Clostridia bacterium]
MLFSHLIRELSLPFRLCGDTNTATEVTHISNDSRQTHKDSLFVCIRGAISDGHDYATAAYANGCRLFVAARPLPLPPDATVLITENTREALHLLSAALYGHPSEQLRVVGITGTKGKTTTALMIAHILNSCGISAGYIGSNGVSYGSYHFHTVNTTPESCDIQRYLRDMVREGVRVCVMEVSSQALKLERVHGVRFDTCVFTNLSPDHISAHEHPDFEDYMACKAKLFRDYPHEHLIYNADDPLAEDVVGASRAHALRFALHHPAEFTADRLSLMREEGKLGLTFRLFTAACEQTVTLPFPGAFSVCNALAAVAVCTVFGLNVPQIAKALETVSVSGRFEVISLDSGVTFVIDYAHNGISLRSALETLRQYRPNRLICLFGSVGGRTQMRRAELGRVAAELADLCIITSDNPDNEPPMNIIRDISAQFAGSSCPYLEIPDREEAIRHALAIAAPGDIVLLAGKGHERYQLIAGKYVPFCERDIIAAEVLRRALSTI